MSRIFVSLLGYMVDVCGPSRSNPTQLYAPQPHAASYPSPVGGAPQDAPFHAPGSSPNHGSYDAHKSKNRIGVDYRDITRTPSPSPSEAEVLSGKKKKRGGLRRYLDPEVWQDRRNVSTCRLTTARLSSVQRSLDLASLVLRDAPRRCRGRYLPRHARQDR